MTDSSYILLLSLCSASVILLLTTRLRDCLMLARARRRYETDDLSGPGRAPAISVIIPAGGQAEALETNLPAIMAQEYPFFEVVVVDEQTESDTADALKRLTAKFPQLRHTFVPPSVRFIGRQKLAITLGIKAAKHEWVVLTRPDCTPASPRWLMGLSAKMGEDKDIVIGYANYDAYAPTGVVVPRLRRALLAFSAALGGRAVDADACNLALRKSYFLTQGGYASQLSFTCGEDGLLVDRLSTGTNTAVACNPETTVWQSFSSRHESRKARVAHRVAGRHLRMRGKLLRLRWGTASLLTYTYAATWLAAVALRALHFPPIEAYRGQEIASDAWAVILLTYPIAEALALRRSTQAVDERPVSARLFFDDLWQPIATLGVKLNAWFSRNDYKRQ